MPLPLSELVLRVDFWIVCHWL